MVVVLISAIIVALYYLVIPKQDTYGNQLENYITSNNPKNVGDVERLTQEFDRKISDEKFL